VRSGSKASKQEEQGNTEATKEQARSPEAIATEEARSTPPKAREGSSMPAALH
jgi:hypothetical protein